MAVVTMRQLLESGVHFGHQTRRWNPKMKRFIFTERNGIYIIDLRQTLDYIEKAYAYVRDTVAEGGHILFVGTKKQAQEAIAEQATRVGQPYVNHRWLGGMLTNFQTVYKRLQRMKELEALGDLTGTAAGYTKKETLQLSREKIKLTKTLGGLRDMTKVPVGDLGRRHQEGAHRRRRGPQAGHPGHRGARHQLRPGRGRLPDPGQRRRDPLGRAADQGRRHRRRRRSDRALRPRPRRRRREARAGHRRRRRAAARVGARPATRAPRRRPTPSRPPPPCRGSGRRCTGEPVAAAAE